ncbi:MAG: tRNA uridine-5-carboxymethylaminomethyl(34) synthesis GTPase MnmE [Defluviitaleaceae bacterium]|nr:tRNA uridine-5-carboxymethylaminomethyl(34) synthesis GTPase MnmE [Defluviitaleaceae bacterium]
MDYNTDSTIVAISTPIGPGAISIVRISGINSLNIIKKIFVPKVKKDIKTHTIHYGYIFFNDKKIDEVIVSFMLHPNSYTKEDVVEINCHGGSITANDVLDVVINEGAVLAQPGEFTKRAFLNGRIDLIQAEAVIDIINSNNRASKEMSLNLLSGGLSKKIENIRRGLLQCIASLEVAIDYPEEEYFNGTGEIQKFVNNSILDIENLINVSKNFDLIKNGISTVIIGRPNVGKSSLLNFLLKEDKAIVTNIAGTTRDLVNGNFNIGHIPINLIDTAGLRDTNDIVEQIGQEKTKEAIKNADLVLSVLDISEEITSEDFEIINSAKDKRLIIVCNKIDIRKDIFEKSVNNLRNIGKVVCISSMSGDGINSLIDEIFSFYPNTDVAGHMIMANGRHLELLNKSIEYLKLSIETIKKEHSEEFISLDLTNAYTSLGMILGNELDESIIDKIFSEFCLGK